jgi:hypothetical protein
MTKKGRETVAPSAPPFRPASTYRLGTMSKFFLSYRRDDDADSTGRIYDRLAARYQAENIFRDVDTMYVRPPPSMMALSDSPHEESH